MPVTVVQIETEKEIFRRHEKEAEESAKAALLPGHVMLQVRYGPYAGKRMMIPESEAGRAVSDGWAYKEGENVLDVPEQDEMSPEETFAVTQKADEAAERLREPDEDKRRKREREQRERKDMEPAERPDTHKYQTRDVKPGKR